jgi:tripartite-type tricarboxylate transporter receptor subunit TctC
MRFAALQSRLPRIAACAALAVAVLAPSLAAAQAFPARPIRLIVPLTPGGTPDTLARTIATRLSETWPQPIVVENRPGAGQNLAGELVAKSPGDGYTWLIVPNNLLVTNPHVGKTPFDPFNDFTPVMQLGLVHFLLVVNPQVDAKNVPELVALAKAKPGELNYGSSGNGSPQHLGAAMLESLAGVRMNHVPYKGAAPAIADLVPGRIQLFIGAANQLLPQIREGKLRLLASAGARRAPMVPDAPTIAESVPGYGLDVWIGLSMPAKVPADIVAKVQRDVAAVLNEPQQKERLAAQGVDVATTTPQAYEKIIRDDHARWGRIIRDAGIKAD